jgi:hypothetical protein
MLKNSPSSSSTLRHNKLERLSPASILKQVRQVPKPWLETLTHKNRQSIKKIAKDTRSSLLHKIVNKE